MACPVCDRTMQNVGATGRRIFWCPFCGTLKEDSGDRVEIEMPSMLQRVVDSVPPLDRGPGASEITMPVMARYVVTRKENEHVRVAQGKIQSVLDRMKEGVSADHFASDWADNGVG